MAECSTVVYGFPTYGKIIRVQPASATLFQQNYPMEKKISSIIEYFILTDIDYLTNDQIKFKKKNNVFKIC